MSNKHNQIEKLAGALTLLVEFVPKTKEELEQWYIQARNLETEHLLNGGLSQDMPHFLWHYLSDADIRMKDESYADIQSRRIHLLLEHLKLGVIPNDEDTYV